MNRQTTPPIPLDYAPRLGRRRPAFTLVELMISIALALMLIYGIAQVFKLSGDTVGANQAVATMLRDQRAAQATLVEDFRNSMLDSPMFLISGRIAYGYNGPGTGFKAGWRNAEEERDEGVGADPAPTTMTINGSTVNAPSIAAGTDRTPRIDRLGFFVRNLYRRQTAAYAQASSGVTSTDAYVWYGHTALVNADGTLTQPFDQYAADRVLGRTAILMKPSGTQYKVGEDPLNPATPPDKSQVLWPLGYVPAPDQSNYNGAFQSVKDLAQVSIDEWRSIADASTVLPPPGGFNFDWFRPMLDYPLGGNQTFYWRAWCRPTVTRPIDQIKMAQTSPYFVGHCTQFIVEYAGDYLNQAEGDLQVPGVPTDAAVKMNPNTGELVYGTTDGQIDYIIDTTADADPPKDPSKWVRRVRWYGLPRDVTGDGHITINDVVPLSDVYAFYEMSMAAPNDTTSNYSKQRAVAPWEIDLPFVTDPTNESFSKKQGLIDPTLKNNAELPPRNANANAKGTKYAQQDYKMIPQTSAKDFKFTAAFHNDAPAMIRITMKIDDPSGKLKDGQWYQFVLSRQ